MKIFITGGAGYVGTAVTRELVTAGHDVVALVRSAERANSVRELGATPLMGALAATGTFASDARNSDAIVHLAAPSGGASAESRAALERLLDLARRGSVRHFVYTSVLFVLGDVPDGADESTPVTDGPHGARAVLEMETLAAAGPRLTCSVIRPGMVYGGGEGGAVSEMFRTALEGSVRYVGDGTNRWSLVHRDDAASLFRGVLERGASGVYHAVDESPMTVARVAQAVAEAAGVGTAPAGVPLIEARGHVGLFADALCLDQPVVSIRSGEIGWKCMRPSFRDAAPDAFVEFSRSVALRVP